LIATFRRYNTAYTYVRRRYGKTIILLETGMRERYTSLMQLEAIIGLEVHAQMNTRTKMFCGCDNDAFGKLPNTTVCPVCMGHPGTLPVVNAEAVQKAIVASLAIRCTINNHSHFDRKHYFYPDLPSGFQISQYDFPLASEGSVEYDMYDDSGNCIATKTCGITRLHIENDAGKLTHRAGKTLCDYNRAGTPLMEIVTKPDLRNSKDASSFAQELRKILIAVGSSDADMFKGMMRFDASISLREVGTTTLNPRSEIKNLNSFKALEKALEYEEKRLRKLWDETGGPLPHDITVGWLDDEEKTRLLRDKESATDYRYFPEPDIPALHFTNEDIARIQKDIPVLPRERKQQYIEQGLEVQQANQLIDEPILQNMYDAIVQKTGDAKRASSIVLTQLIGFLNAAEKSFNEAPSALHMVELAEALQNNSISSNTAKHVLETMVQTGKGANDIIAEEGLQQISDTSAIEQFIVEAMEKNPKAVADFKQGNEKALGPIVGYVMKLSGGQANPGLVNELIMKKL
jgi:aspartyl-tRNA(Asn)/glutamyl-tRNA(Gln) amidotransferase subunit B